MREMEEQESAKIEHVKTISYHKVVPILAHFTFGLLHNIKHTQCVVPAWTLDYYIHDM